MLDKLVGGTVAQRILTYLAARPSETFFEQQVAGETHTSIGAAHAALHKLSDTGLLRLERKGRRVFYRVDLRHPLVRQWKVLRTVEALEPVLVGLRQHSELVILYGSRAAGTDLEDSDIDLYVRTSHPEEVKRVVESSGLVDRIQLVARSVLQEAEMEKANPVFLANVRRGIVLYDATGGS